MFFIFSCSTAWKCRMVFYPDIRLSFASVCPHPSPNNPLQSIFISFNQSRPSKFILSPETTYNDKPGYIPPKCSTQTSNIPTTGRRTSSYVFRTTSEFLMTCVGKYFSYVVCEMTDTGEPVLMWNFTCVDSTLTCTCRASLRICVVM